MNKGILTVAVLVTGLIWMLGSPSDVQGAYSAHQNDTDVNSFLAVYPSAKSTKLDDCALCHPGGQITQGGRTTTYGSCDFCHITYKLQPPHGSIPLNGYGQDYKKNGGHPASSPPDQANQAALRAIELDNSDGDSHANLAEIQALTFPGDNKDYPGLVPAPAVGLNLEQILKQPGYSEFLLVNASNSRDFYARYSGVRIKDLLKYAGVRKEATQITVFSPDGFSKTFPIDVADPQADPKNIQYDVMGPYPYGTYYEGLDFVDYSFLPRCLDNGDRIPDKLYMLLAYLRDGDPLSPGKINPSTLRLDGEGPYRLIPPQKIAGRPDRSCRDTAIGDGWDCDENKDHNAGSSVRTVSAIRVEPLPAGTTDFNVFEGGWNLVDHGRMVIYGAIDPPTYRVGGKVSESGGEGIPDVKLAFSLLSLGQVGEAITSPGGGHFKKKFEAGKFRIDLPAGAYTVVPSKEGCVFTPSSLAISLPDPECDLDRDHWDPWDHRDRWEHCNRHPENEINITATCSK
jgi:hypothetical protein